MHCGYKVGWQVNHLAFAAEKNDLKCEQQAGTEKTNQACVT